MFCRDSKYFNGILPVVAYDPDYLDHPWKDNSRLKFIKLVYRTKGSNAWQNAIDSAGIPVLFGITNAGAYLSSSWDLSTIEDGSYEIALHAACTPSLLASASPQSSDSFSEVVAVKLDQQAPYVLSMTSPAAHEALLPGGMITLLFNEPIMCEAPLNLAASITAFVGTATVVLSGDELVVRCNNDVLQIFFSPDKDAIVSKIIYSTHIIYRP